MGLYEDRVLPHVINLAMNNKMTRPIRSRVCADLEGDVVEIRIDCRNLTGSIDLVGSGGEIFGAEEGARILAKRNMRPDLAPDPQLPDDSRLWAALQNVSGGTWGGAVFDVDSILKTLEAGRKALSQGNT